MSNLWFPFSHTADLRTGPPLVIQRGEGVYLVGDNGRRYLDAVSSWWVSIFGHCHPKISEAVRTQAGALEHVMMAGFVSSPALRLGELLRTILPPDLTRVFYSDDGSTSVEVALKIALQYWANRGEHRDRFIAFSGAYHGDTLGAMSVGAVPVYHNLFHQRFKQQLFTDPPYCYRCPVGKSCDTCGAECMDSLESLLERHGESVAAVVFEPMVQGAVGMRIYPAKVLTRVFALCDRFEVLTIADEVAMGFGRTGTMFATQHCGRAPDIMCLAKGLTGGYLPLAATVVKEHIYERFRGSYRDGRTLYHGHSFTGNPLAAAAACAACELLVDGDIPASLSGTFRFYGDKLREYFGDLECVGDIRSLGSVGALEIVQDRATKASFPAERRVPFLACRHAVERGVVLRPLGDVIYFMPPYIITPQEIETMFEITREALTSVVYE